jgi:GTP-binding protein HflX
MARITGNTKFLTSFQRKKLSNLFKRKVPNNQIFSYNILNTISKISREIYKQIAAVIDRRGNLQYIIIGTENEILFPTFYEFHLNRFNLRGISVIHTHLHNQGLDYDDLTDLAYLRLDFICSIIVTEKGNPEKIEISRIDIVNGKNSNKIIYSGSFKKVNIDFNNEINFLESEIAKYLYKAEETSREKVLLVNAGRKSKYTLEEEMEELINLSKAANFEVVGSIIQRLNKINPSLILGKGKFKELIITSIEKNASKIIFYHDLTPAQAKFIASFADIEIIDRTTLILNIFSKRAISKEGKLKVELAKLKYLLPRVADKAEALSRIRGGIGLKGPGETIAEVERRRIRNRIKTIEKELINIANKRNILRIRRAKKNVPVVSIIGYTNAGKSTLLNTLTKSDIFVENLYFATLDTFSRKFFLEPKRELIITDTVGFIKNLPKDLMDAFKSTLEELTYSDLLIHVVDISDDNFSSNIEVVDNILKDIGAENVPQVLVFNKTDKVDKEIVANISERYDAIIISAKNKDKVKPLIKYLQHHFRK